jgi:hypothetical protein
MYIMTKLTSDYQLGGWKHIIKHIIGYAYLIVIIPKKNPRDTNDFLKKKYVSKNISCHILIVG